MFAQLCCILYRKMFPLRDYFMQINCIKSTLNLWSLTQSYLMNKFRDVFWIILLLHLIQRESSEPDNAKKIYMCSTMS